MTTPNMSSITSSLERSLQSFSLNHHHKNHSSSSGRGGGGGGIGVDGGDGGGFQENQHDISKSTSETTYELNSHISLPYHWEQCIDLKTGELYYINWRTGMKAQEDPRTAPPGWNDDFDDEDSEDDDSSYDTEDSSSEESPPSFSRNQCINNININKYNNQSNEKGNVLVVAGCKVCMMYFMVPKQGEDCPKCNGQLLHFDKSENASSP